MMAQNLMDSLPYIANQLNRARSVFLGLDFDGTLAPICPRPDDVVLADSVRAMLGRLAHLSRVTVMIVSGRSLADVSRRIGLPHLIYAGNHGLEIRGPGLVFLEGTSAALADRLRELSSRLQEALQEVHGALVEPKSLTTSVHFRNVASDFQHRVEQIVRGVIASESDHFVLASGHRVWEIRPRVSWHKGRAVNWVLERLADPQHRLAFYFGDDETDEDAFVSLPEGVTVKVGQAATTRAHYQVADSAAVEQFLGWLLELLSARSDALIAPGPIARYLDLLDEQREAIFTQLGNMPDAVLWYRPAPRVWSIGEHLDHTRVINCCARRLMIAYFPLASLFARLSRNRPYQAEIDDVFKRPGIPMNVGWIWPPKYTPRRPLSVAFLHEALRAEHAAYRRFFTMHDEQLLGHVLVADPYIGALNLVQWLRVQAYHDAHHYERVRVRIDDPEYVRKAAAAGNQQGHTAR